MSSWSSSRAAPAHQFPALARLRASSSGAFGAGAFGGALVPPRVVQAGDGVAQGRADGAGVAADQPLDGFLPDAQGAGDARRAVAHHVQGAQPQPGPSGGVCGPGKIL